MMFRFMLPAEKLRVPSTEIGIYARTMPHAAGAAQAIRQTMEESHRVGVQFLLTDVAAALTFLDLAEGTRVEETRNRNRQSALSAYETITGFLQKVSPSPEEKSTLDVKLEELRDRLLALGYLADSEEAESSGT